MTGASITRGTRELPLVDAEFAGGDLCIPGTLDAAKVTGKIVLCRRGAVGRADKSLAVFQAGGAGMILYNNDNTDNLFTDRHWVPSVHVDFTPGVKVKEFIAKTEQADRQDHRHGEEDPHQLRPVDDDLLVARARTRAPATSSSRTSPRRGSRSWPATRLSANCPRLGRHSER